jgi:hypothetical protein
LVPTAPPAAATVHIRGFRVTAERFQKLDQKLDSKLDAGAKETAPETAPETTTLSTPKPPTRPPESAHKEDRDSHKESASDAAATSDVDAAAAALRKLASAVSDRNARSDSSSALPAVTVHVSCEGGVVVTSPEAPGDRSASVADVRAAKPPTTEVNTPGPREDVKIIAYDSDDEARAAYGSLEMVWSDDAMPSVTLGPVEADARGVNTGGRTFEGSSDEKNASSNTDSPTKQRGRLGNPVRAAGRLLAGARRASRGDSNRSGRGTPIGTGSEPSSRRVSLDDPSSIDNLKSSDASAHAAALARGIEALTVSSGDDTSARKNTWTRRARVASLGERHAVVTVCVDGVAVGSASVSLFEPCLNALSEIQPTREVSDDTDVLVRSADCAFVVPLTRCGRLFGRVEGTVSIATPGGPAASSS